MESSERGTGMSESDDPIESDNDETIDAVVHPTDALRAALTEAEEGVRALQERYSEAERQRHESEAAAMRAREKINSARERFKAEIEVARAQSALDTLRDTVTVQPDIPLFDEEIAVLNAASKITKKWVKEDQEPLLNAVSDRIATLARSFGATNITSVNLKGNGNMDVFKGRAETTYSRLTNGEKLRIKLAAVVALIELGHRDGVGRHPGLLFVDSPAAEEIPETDLKTMLEAMASIAEETDLQIVVATTHGAMLSKILPSSNLLVATDTDFLW